MPKSQRDPITAANLAKLSVDSSNRLYWNGQQIRTRLQLNWWQGIVAGPAVPASLATISMGLNNLTILVCSRGVAFPLIGCPVQAVTPGPSQPARPWEGQQRQHRVATQRQSGIERPI
jgi:hypothetical protein